jgi:hypothetical protein
MSRIRIRWPSGETTASLRDTPTARQLLDALPVSNRASVWGDEVYFGLPFDAQPEPDATTVVEPGAVCFWLDGSALALLFGPTPVSRGGECRLISEANVLGMLEEDPRCLASVKPGDSVEVSLMVP